jgi:hypothetical protein
MLLLSGNASLTQPGGRAFLKASNFEPSGPLDILPAAFFISRSSVPVMSYVYGTVAFIGVLGIVFVSLVALERALG